MEVYTTNFPETIEINENPIIDFYKKTLESVGLNYEAKKVDVTKFKVHPNDQKKIEALLIKYITKKNPKRTPKKKIKSIAAWTDFDIGPSVSQEIKEGTVSFVY
jgi:hypothetical protein